MLLGGGWGGWEERGAGRAINWNLKTHTNKFEISILQGWLERLIYDITCRVVCMTLADYDFWLGGGRGRREERGRGGRVGGGCLGGGGGG